MRRIMMSIGVMAACLLTHAKAMALPEPFYLFSQVEGRVTMDGEPIAGASVERIYTWKSETHKESVQTDSQGRYAFEDIKKRSLLWTILPHEPFIYQRILIHHQGVTYKGWSYSKHDYDKNGELNGRAIRLNCDFNTPEGPHFDSQTYGICLVDFSQD